VKTVIHWGQRKLLLSEVEFLTLYGHLSSVVVYAGAAPGTHTGYLARLFPQHRFVLLDPAPFTVRETDRILCRNELFTDDVAREFAGKGVLFIRYGGRGEQAGKRSKRGKGCDDSVGFRKSNWASEAELGGLGAGKRALGSI
jgi:hypothetical protein